ncbi:NusG domain II-containing protein [Eubacteriales bacterium OttesenSCG-928-M02]|nr:NusG domain II-containing protein [Eubacteriales bacterium OttesenSCG-928-M02]
MKRWDIPIILIIVLIGLAGWLVASSRPTGAYGVVSVDGEEVYRAPLSDAGQYTVQNQYGTNTISFGDGTVQIHAATCPDQLCVHRGRLFRVGEAAVCLPNHVVVFVVGEGEPEVDTIAE